MTAADRKVSAKNSAVRNARSIIILSPVNE
jgi:hypothetical protein